MVPSNRPRDGAWLEASAKENLTLPRLKAHSKFGAIKKRREQEHVQDWMERTGTVPKFPNQRLGGFSGGNQQKVVIAKWLATDPKILILDEPTQGVDAGAKHDLLEMLLEQAKAGTSLIMVSGELDMLAHVCTRVLVMKDGQIAHEVIGDELTEETLMRRCNSF